MSVSEKKGRSIQNAMRRDRESLAGTSRLELFGTHGGAKFISDNVDATACRFLPKQILGFGLLQQNKRSFFSGGTFSVLVIYLVGAKIFPKLPMMSMDLDQPVALPSIHQQTPTILCCNCGAPIDGTTAAGA